MVIKNVEPMTEQQRADYGKRLRRLATPEAQAASSDPEAAAEFLAQLADKYDPPPVGRVEEGGMTEPRDAQGRTMARRCIDCGNEFPYDAPDACWVGDGNNPPPPPTDWAHSAARGILYDLCGRGGIKHGFDDIDEEVRTGIVSAIADIIREAAPKPPDVLIAMCPFDRRDHGLKPEDPCPVCGDLGTF